MANQSIAGKANEYLTAGRVAILSVTDKAVTAQVQGSANYPYTVHRSEGIWRCDCPAQVSHCAHIVAVEKVVPDAKVTKPDLAGDATDSAEFTGLGDLFDSLAKDEADSAWMESI